MIRVCFSVIALIISITGYSQINWTPLNDIPNSIAPLYSETKSVVVNNEVYVFDIDKILKYNPSSDTWSFVSNYPDKSRLGACLMVLGNALYVMGGVSSGDTPEPRGLNWKYDLENDLWQQKSNLPFNDGFITTYSMVAFTYGDFGYLLNHVTKKFYRYNPDDDTWVSLSDFPQENILATIKPYFLYGSKFYITYQGSTEATWEYNILTDTWMRKSDAPLVFMSNAFFVIGENGYVGFNNDKGILSNAFFKYNFKNDVWSQINDAPFVADLPCSFSVNDVGYIGSGFSSFWKFEDTTLGVENVNFNENSLDIYPNPLKQNTYLYLKSTRPLENKSYALYSLLGQNILKGTIRDDKIFVPKVDEGIYVLLIENKSYKIFIKG